MHCFKLTVQAYFQHQSLDCHTHWQNRKHSSDEILYWKYWRWGGPRDPAPLWCSRYSWPRGGRRWGVRGWLKCPWGLSVGLHSLEKGKSCISRYRKRYSKIYKVPILSPVTYYCSSWISGREKNVSWLSYDAKLRPLCLKNFESYSNDPKFSDR